MRLHGFGDDIVYGLGNIWCVSHLRVRAMCETLSQQINIDNSRYSTTNFPLMRSWPEPQRMPHFTSNSPFWSAVNEKTAGRVGCTDCLMPTAGTSNPC